MKTINGKDRVGFAILGLGIGMAHAEALSGSEYAYIACACDIDGARREKFEKRYPGVPVYSNYEDILENEEVDVVSLCLPTYMHAEYAIRILKAGKHVLSEKPADISVERALLMRDVEKESGKLLGFVFQNRFNYNMYPIYDAIRSRRLGRIYLGTFAVKWYRKQKYYDANGGWRGTWWGDGGGSLINQSVHTLDLMLTLMGDDIKAVSSAGGVIDHDIDTEDMTASLITFEGGATATFVSTTCAYDGLSTEIAIYGTDGSIEADADRIIRWRLKDDPDGIEEEKILERYGAGNLSGGTYHCERCGHGYIIDDMARAVLGGRRPAVGIDDALKSLSLVERIYKNIRTEE